METYNDAETFDLKGFSKIENLKGKTLEFDSLVMHPSDIIVYDSLLVLVEPKCDKMIHIYNLNSRKREASHISFGQGPYEMIRPKFIANNTSGDTLQLFDKSSYCIMKYDMKAFRKPEKVMPFDRVKLSQQVFLNVEKIGNDIWGYSHNPKYQFYLFDACNGNKINEIIGYPLCNVEYSDIEKVDAFYMNFVSNGADKIAICYCMTDLIDFYNIDGTLHKRIHGPEHFFSHFNDYKDGKVVSSSPDKNTRDAYFSPCSAGDNLMVLYNGGLVNDSNHSSSCKWIFSFSWDGKPNVAYKLSDPLLFMTVDEKHRKIYGISNIPEYHIVEYTF
ncbi:BF3164 family lipoprotein [Phocaeicola paurosaccharolyticus]|uniref:BF3164 family lipoprotein n=2 Tax=Phocaeicola paurosaccharolyticus TaxID=732242 RepID=UPI002FDF193B